MESLKASLRKAIDKNLTSNTNSKRNEVSDDTFHPDALFEKEFREINLGLKDSEDRTSVQSNESKAKYAETALSVVPPFYVSLPPENDDLRQKLREEARAQFLQRRSKALLDNEELKALYSLLESNASSTKAVIGDGSGNTGGSNLSSLETSVPGKRFITDGQILPK